MKEGGSPIERYSDDEGIRYSIIPDEEGPEWECTHGEGQVCRFDGVSKVIPQNSILGIFIGGKIVVLVVCIVGLHRQQWTGRDHCGMNFGGRDPIEEAVLVIQMSVPCEHILYIQWLIYFI